MEFIFALSLFLWLETTDQEFRFESATAEGVVVEVASGDTLLVQFEYGPPLEIRLTAIDAPALDQPYGQEAKSFLEDLVLDELVRVRPVRGDFGTKRAIAGSSLPVVASVHLASDRPGVARALSTKMLETGNAWRISFAAMKTNLRLGDGYVLSDVLRQRNPKSRSTPYQDKARRRRLGLWAAANPIAPWNWNARMKKTIDNRGFAHARVLVCSRMSTGQLIQLARHAAQKLELEQGMLGFYVNEASVANRWSHAVDATPFLVGAVALDGGRAQIRYRK